MDHKLICIEDQDYNIFLNNDINSFGNVSLYTYFNIILPGRFPKSSP